MISRPFTLLIFLNVAFFLQACANQKETYRVIVPPAQSTIIGIAQSDNNTFEIRYRYDQNGEMIFTSIHSTGEYSGGDRETIKSITDEAKQRMIQSAIAEANGVILSAKTEVHQRQVQQNGQTSSYMSVQDETLQKISGFARIKEHECHTQSLPNGVTHATCKGVVEVPQIDSVKINH